MTVSLPFFLGKLGLVTDSPDGTFVGQNLARFPHGTDPYSHVATWIYEKRWFDYETRTCPNFMYCGHYNQVTILRARRCWALNFKELSVDS